YREILFDVKSLLFYYASDNCRDIPSFPTRRSSDLSESAYSGLTPRGKLRASPRSGPAVSRYEPRPASTKQPCAPVSFTALVRPQDRKSTRLNSSHVKISYAVFCLKKKKHH